MLVLGLSQNLYTIHPVRVFVFSVATPAANRDSCVARACLPQFLSAPARAEPPTKPSGFSQSRRVGRASCVPRLRVAAAISWKYNPNVLVRFLVRDNAKQAARAASLIRAGEIWISKTVLLETEWSCAASMVCRRTAWPGR